MTNQTVVPASPGQLSAVGFKIAGTINRVIADSGLSFEQADHLILSEEKELEKMTERFCAEILGVEADPWIVEKRRIEKFYEILLGRRINWKEFSLPPKNDKMRRLEVIFWDVSEDEIFTAYARKFGKDSVWKHYSNGIAKSICKQQKRSEGNYAFSHVGGSNPDMLDKSYNDGINAGIKFMVPKEGIIAALRYRIETSKMYDVNGLTRFAALTDNGCAMCMCMYRSTEGKFCVSIDGPGFRGSGRGLRQVNLA